MQFQHQRFWLKQNTIAAPAAADPTNFEQLKRELKEWEHAFQKEHGRKPTKQDLDKYPEIRRKYKKHASLKSKPEDSPRPVSDRKRKHEETQADEPSEEEKDANWAITNPLPVA